jgi:hypothetical protein
MRILMVSFNFPPYNVIGAVRAGKLAKFLHQRGHELRVLSAAPQMFPSTLPCEVPEALVVRTGWVNLNRPFEQAARRVAGSKGIPGTSTGTSAFAVAKRAADVYRAVVGVPDMQVGWLPAALTRGRALTAEWKPDVIFASAPPATALLVGAALSRRAACPWVVEFRDLWTQNPYNQTPKWRRPLDRALERRTLGDVSAAITISDPLAADLRKRVSAPVVTVANGFDPDDFLFEARGDPRPDILKLFHGGTIYPGRRDPGPLFEALASLGADRAGFEVEFSGQDLRGVADLAARHGVLDCVRVAPFRPYRESLRCLGASDVGLLLLWNDPAEAGVLPVKLFESIGARRPILALGYQDGEAARLVRDRHAGAVLNDPGEIAAWLRERRHEKRRCGRLPSLPATVGIGLSRAEQFTKLEACLEAVVHRFRA